MRLLAALIITTASVPASAWFCDEASSQRNGHVYSVCGVATSGDEASARESALLAAYNEFSLICERSDDCLGYKATIDPQRTECRKERDNYTCRRLIEVTVSNSQKKPEAHNIPISQTKATIFKGQSQSELLSLLGSPEEVIDAENGYKIYVYRNRKECTASTCSALIRENIVERYSGFKLAFTDQLAEKPTLFQKVKGSLNATTRESP